MNELTERIAGLILKYLDEDLNQTEREELDKWMGGSEENLTKFNELTNRQQLGQKLEKFEQYNVEAGWGKLKSQYSFEETPVVSLSNRRSFLKYAAAAILIIMIGIGGWFVFLNKKPGTVTAENRFKNDIDPPQTNKATITLGDGSVIILDNAQNGSLGVEGGSNLTKLSDGQIKYSQSGVGTEEVKYNTLTVPKGSKPVQLMLADGSQVWLDASSSITYPTAFVGKERNVEMTGQAYFEIEKNAAKPFTVKKKGDDTRVQVLGTHFNVNAFDDESSIKVTLLEGSVKVTKGSNEQMITPGQQAQISSDGVITLDKNVDIDQVMAWKNGMFNFQGARIETIMREVARWYDVEIVYQGRPKDEFVAPISRNVPVSKLLTLLELTNRVHFKIEGRKITVME